MPSSSIQIVLPSATPPPAHVADPSPQEGRWSRVPSAASLNRRLSAGDWRVLNLLCMYADKNGRCFPSQTLLARKLDILRQSVGRHIKRLESYGYLLRDVRPRNNRGGFPRTYYKILYLPFPA